ncbi:leucine-rich repeat protein [Capnocytophaga leadbetteri]
MRTKILKFIAVLSMVLLAFNGCKKDEGEEPNPTPQPKTPENVVVFDKEVIEKKIDTITNDGTLVFSSLSEKEKPKVGDIICSGVAQGAPQGFLYKVKDIQEKNGKTTIITEKAYLEDAIGDGEFEQNIIISARDVQAIYNSKGEQVENQIKLPPLNSSTERPYDVQAYDTKLESSIKFEIDTELEKNLKLKGSVEAGISLDFKIKIGFLKVEELALIVNPQIKGEIKVAWSKKLKGKEEGKNYELGVIKLAPITVPISGIPVVITPKIIIILHVDIEGKIELSGKILSVEASPKFGPVYKNGHWSFLGMNEGDNKDLINVDFFKEVKFGLSGELKIGPRIIADYTFYNSDTGAGLGIGFYGKLKSDLAVKVEPSFEQIKDLEFDPKITLSAGIEAIYKTELNIFRFKAELEGSKEFLKWQIAEHHIFPKFSELVTSLDPEGNKVVACKVERMPSRLLWSVSQHGFCWTNQNRKPTIEDAHSELGELAGTILDLDAYEMKVKLPTLLPNSTYSIRPYYTFWGGTYYGSELTFNTEQPKEFNLSVSTLNLKKGENSTVKITSGNGTYVVSSSNKTVATASVSDTNKKEIVIVAHNKGTATIIVEDNVSKTKKEIKVTVTEADNNLVLSANSITLKEGEHKVVNITSGSGVYIVKSNNESVVLANEVKAGVIGIIAKGAGNATVIVKDKATKQQKTIEVTVTKETKENNYNIPEDVIIENGVLKKWPDSAVPEDGHITIPNGVTRIDNRVFWNNKKLKTISMPNTLTSIGLGAFSGCHSLQSLAIPNSVTSIEEEAFYSCISLKTVTIPSSITIIERKVFETCTALVSVNIPNTVTNIKYKAFHYCPSLVSVTIPSSVKMIEEDAFGSCSKLSTVISKSPSPTNIKNFGYSGKLIVPNGTKELYQQATGWKNCSPIVEEENKKVDINEGLIAYYPFNGNANDYSGNGNNGTVYGAQLTSDKNGKHNAAYTFDGVNDFIKVPTSSSLENFDKEITISAWININKWFNSGSVGYFPILEKSDESSIGGLMNLHINTSTGIQSIYRGNIAYNNYKIPLNQWVYVSFVCKNNTAYFYIDGNLIGKKQMNGNYSYKKNSPLIIGKDIPGLVEYANGKIDEIRIYNRALSDSEIKFLYQNSL